MLSPGDLVADLLEYDALHLFVQRAIEAAPAFVQTPLDLGAIVTICQRLDGIPLAIELAAVRVRLLTPEQIVQRLDHIFQLLTRSSGAILPRHKTLRATLDWSYGLLSETERTVFSRLSVFVGGLTLEAAEVVCVDESISSAMILDIVSELVDQALVTVVEPGGNGQIRYRLLEPVRQYAWDRLSATQALDRVQRQHAEFFLALAGEVEGHLHGHDQAVWLNRLDLEHSNLRRALGYCCDLPRSSGLGLQLAASLAQFWWLRGYLTEGREWLGSLLARGDSVSGRVRAHALLGAGRLAFRQYDHTQALALYEESLSLWQVAGDQEGAAWTLCNLAEARQYRLQYDEAHHLIQESLRLFRELGHKSGIASALNVLAEMVWRRGDYDQALALYDESLALSHELGDSWGVALALSNAGFIALQTGDRIRARSQLEEGLAIRRAVGDKFLIALSLNTLGEMAREEGDYPRAEQLYSESLVLYRELGQQRAVAAMLHNLAHVAHHLRDLDRAGVLFKESLMMARDIGSKQGMVESLAGVTKVMALQGQHERAVRLCGVVDAVLESLGSTLEPIDRDEYDTTIAGLHSALDAEAFAQAWADGRAMALQRAVTSTLANA